MDYSKSYIKQILNEVKTIALVGASSREERDSFKVMKSLLENGYEVFPVNPNEEGNLIFCLLYTSPSPRDQRGSRMPSSA